MIIDSSIYKRNAKTGEIVKRQMIKVRCDRCGKVKERNNSDYKRRKNKDHDYCKSCSNILGITGCKGRKSGYKTKIEILCEECGQTTFKYKKSIDENNHNFCSSKCNFRYEYKRRYSYLLNNFKNYSDELCYLMGAILGDGTVTSVSRLTKKIAIFCNDSDIDVMKIIKDILDKIHIAYFICANGKERHCVSINFNIPNDILAYFGILFYGDKFKEQPLPNEKCTNNINFAIGLFNSDGYFVKRFSSGCRVLSFNNTVKSIVGSIEKCLSKNGIYYKTRGRKNLNLNWKNSYDVCIERQGDIDKLIGLASFNLKRMRLAK